MLGRPRSRGGGVLSRIPQVGVLEERGVRRQGGGDEADAAVEKAARREVVANEPPQGPGTEVPGRGPAAAGVQLLGAPAGVEDDLLEMVRQVAVWCVADAAAQLARIGNGLEVFVHAGLDEASGPLEQPHMPVARPATTAPRVPEGQVQERGAVSG